jgi:hypothetical protein
VDSFLASRVRVSLPYTLRLPPREWSAAVQAALKQAERELKRTGQKRKADVDGLAAALGAALEAT